MKKKYIAALVAGAAAGAFCVYRDRKYPVRRELRFANKLVVPGFAVRLETARLSNRFLSALPLPEPPHGVKRQSTRIQSGDGAFVDLTIYRPAALAGEAPCLVYFHGGGFCTRDAGYIHRYAARYAEGAGCMVVFVHYRTSDIAPFPKPFQDCHAALRWGWENGPALGVDRTRIAVGGDSAAAPWRPPALSGRGRRGRFPCASSCWSTL